ncbi:MAG: DUF547 domain-containing protein [Asgard group archaeon]|nr:DUF547 domain-containing protein [Asgard group archaeon]
MRTMSKAISFKSNPLLANYIDSKGLVNYKKIKEEKWFWEQINYLQNIQVEKLSDNELFAFWLNTYNLLTIKGVLDILEKNPNWKGNTSLLGKLKFFILKKHKVADKKLTLNYIEHKIIRKQFRDPRIHFAINCGSTSCPFLPTKIIQPDKLEKTLDGLTSFFINSGNIQFDHNKKILFVSKIFKWYRKDFKRVGGIKHFISIYLKAKIKDIQDYKIKFLKYDWSLNNQ